MKQLKFAIAGAGALGIIAVFLPYFSMGGESMTYWDVHKMEGGEMLGLLNGPKQVYIALACFAVPLVLGLIAIATKQLQRWQAIAAAVFSLAALAPAGVRKGLTGEEGMSTAIGGKLLFLAALIGLVAAIAGVAKPEKA